MENLAQFFHAVAWLLKIVNDAGPVLFRAQFRANYTESLPGVIEQILQYMQHEYILNPEQYPEMQEAGLVGQQLQTKLESFEFSLSQFAEDGGVENLEDALDKGRTILNSLAGAVPGFGSFAQELVDFILKELKRRFRI